MDPYQLARDCGDIGDRPVNPLSLANDIGVLGAYDDARVGGVLLMQANEVAPVQGEDDTLPQLPPSLRRHARARAGLGPRSAGNSRWHKTLPRSSRLVAGDVLLNLVSMGLHVRPSPDQIYGAQRWKTLEQLRLSPAKLSVTFKSPDGNPGAHDARRAPGYAWITLNSGPDVGDLKR